MDSSITIILSLIFAYLAISYFLLIKKEINVNKSINTLSLSLDQRFKIFEDYIFTLTENKIDYEQTFLKEIVQLRLQAQKAKSDKDFRSEFFYEEKISKLSIKINFLIENSTILKSLKESENMQQNILAKEEKLLILKNDYNNNLVKFNKMKSLPIFILITILIPKFNKKIDFWIIH